MHQRVHRQGAFQIGADVEHIKIVVLQQTCGIGHFIQYGGNSYANSKYRVSDISHAIQTYVESNGFSVVRAFVGHGVGAQLHEEPEVPNYGNPGRGPRMLPGMTMAIEPMVNAGVYDVKVLKDGWTTVTADGKLSAHYENTVLITDGEPEILTVAENSDV